MDYNGNASTQLTGSRWQHYNCVAATGSTLTDAASCGYHDPSPDRLRSLAGTDPYQGITYPAIDRAIYAATNGEVGITVRYWAPGSILEDLIDAGRRVAFSGYTGVTRYTAYRTGTFVGRHCFGLFAKRIARWRDADTGAWKSQKQGLVLDPGSSEPKFVWWPWNLILKTAYASAGEGMVHVFYTADLRGVPRNMRTRTPVRTAPRGDAPYAKRSDGSVMYVRDEQVITQVRTQRGSRWYYNRRSGRGWVKVGSKRWVPGGRVRPR